MALVAPSKVGAVISEEAVFSASYPASMVLTAVVSSRRRTAFRG